MIADPYYAEYLTIAKKIVKKITIILCRQQLIPKMALRRTNPPESPKCVLPFRSSASTC